MFLASFPVGYISDHAVNSGRVSAGFARKLFNTIGFMGPAGGLIWLAFVGCNSTLAVAALVISNTIAASAFAGFNVSTEKSVYPRYTSPELQRGVRPQNPVILSTGWTICS
jgi:hypothetical protein